MARPIKTGLDYFPLDVDFFNDEKVIAVAGEFGLKGEITIIKLLCAIYRNGYFIEWSEIVRLKLLKELQPGVSADLLDSIVNRLVKYNFFDGDIFKSDNVLTSHGIQKRFCSECSAKHRKIIIDKYCLLSKAKHKTNAAIQVKQEVNSPLYAPALLPKPPQNLIPLSESIPQMKQDTIWNEAVCIRYHVTTERLMELFDKFELYCRTTCDQTEHDNLAHAKRHFCMWLSRGGANVTDAIITSNTKTTDTSPPANPNYQFTGGFGGVDV